MDNGRNGMYLTPEELLAGHEALYDIQVSPALLHPNADGKAPTNGKGGRVCLRPLTVRDIQLIAKAAKDDEVLTSILMIQRSMVEPALKQPQIAELSSGLVAFLVDCINRISGLSTAEDELKALVDSPLGKAFFILAREFHWTPDQVRELTVGQILGYLEMLNQTQKVS